MYSSLLAFSNRFYTIFCYILEKYIVKKIVFDKIFTTYSLIPYRNTHFFTRASCYYASSCNLELTGSEEPGKEQKICHFPKKMKLRLHKHFINIHNQKVYRIIGRRPTLCP